MNAVGGPDGAMFRIKICGVTRVRDAALAAAAGADAVGVNFYEGSRRYVPPGRAAAIVRAAAEGGATVVGVFVNARPEAVEAICRDLEIGVVQLSGDEPPDEAARLPFRRIKAVRITAGFDAAALAGYPCDAFLVDAGGPAEFGGTGRTLNWAAIRAAGLRKPWMLAGGLTPETVRTAIRVARPDGVDVATGVEDRPGRKDAAKVKDFINNARKGFDIEGI